MISVNSALLIFSLVPTYFVRAANDWSVPCISGGCSWDTGDGEKTAYSSMAIGGANDLVSDITPAAGWSISGCDPNWKEGSHTVQATCTGSANQTAHCGHVYDGGAENTIVRLPESCGKDPFARIVSATNKTNSISPRAAKSSSMSGTHTFTLDYNFKQVPTSRGKVTFAVTSTNLKGLPGVSKRDLDALRGRGRAGELHRKRFAHLRGSRRGFGDFLSDAADDAADFVGDAASAVTSAAGAAASAVGSAVSDANSFNKSLNSGKLTPVSFNKDVVLFDKSISCNSGDVSANAEFKIDVDGKVDATVSFGVTLVGTIVPPKIDDFSVTSDLGGSASATFNIDAKAEGKFDTTSVQLFKTGFPGLEIPSVITLGPEFSINAQVTVDLKAEAKMAIQAAWDFPNVKLIFPEEKGASNGAATVSNTNNPLQLSADPSVDVSATVGAHIIPRVDFGVDLFSGSVQASVFVDADISATLSAEAKASAKANNKNATTTSASAASTASSTTSAANDSAVSADSSTTATDTSAEATDTATSTAATDATTDAAAASPTGIDTATVNSDGGDASTSSDPQATDTAAQTESDTAASPGQTDAATSDGDATTGNENVDDTDPSTTGPDNADHNTTTDDDNADNVDGSAPDPATDDPTSAGDGTAGDTDEAPSSDGAPGDDSPTDDPPVDASADESDTGTDSGEDAGAADTGSDDASFDYGGGFFKRRSFSGLRKRETSASASACVTLNGGIAINGGLTGSLEPFISKQEKTFKIFSKDVQLFQKCLGGAQPNAGAAEKKRRHLAVVARAGDSSGLTCPTGGVVSALQSLI